MSFASRFAPLLAAAALVLTPLAAHAQSALPSADAAAFMGTWTLSLQSPQGAFEQTLVIKDMAGKVGAEVSNQMQPTPMAITDITKAANDLLMKFMGDFQGQAFSATITLTPDAADANKAFVMFDIMDGQFVMQGAAVKK